MVLTGYDFSNWQANLKLKDFKSDFFIFKATEGLNFVDRTCDRFVHEAKALNKPYGVYHFLDGSDVIKQADFFVNNIKGYVGEAILVLDYEMYGMQGAPAAKRFLDRVFALTGVRPLIYMSESVTREDDWTAVVNANYGLWVAKYSTQQPNVGYWKNIAMWQYTDRKPYDHNIFYGDLNAWKAYAKVIGKETPKPTEPTKPTKPTETPKPTTGGKLKMKEVTLTTDVYLRTKADTKSKEIALLKKGEKVKFDDIIVAQGYMFGVQTRTDKFKKGYVALGEFKPFGTIK